MKKEDLKNGCIVVTRNGYLGVVIEDGYDSRILYQETGMDGLDLFDDDLTSIDDEEWDIMEIYGGRLGYCSFYDVDHENDCPDWSREIGWQRPSAEECEAREAEFERQRLQRVEEMRKQQEDERLQREAERKKYFISIISQCFYGNRTGTKIRREDVKRFIRGFLTDVSDALISDVNLEAIPVPADKNIVIVYDRTEEDKYLNVDFPIYSAEYRERTGEELSMRVTCSIPMLGVELHTRCFACRIDEDGVFQSLENGDEEQFIDYFTV